MSSILKRILRRTIHPPISNFFETCRFYPAPRKRFYKNVTVTESDGKFEVNLDKRKLKTPLGNLLQLPNEALATAVATEWDLQGDTIQQHFMHITSLCNTALDNPCRETKETLSDSALQFFHSDTLCHIFDAQLTKPVNFKHVLEHPRLLTKSRQNDNPGIYTVIIRGFRTGEPPELVDLQNEKWNPLLQWFQSRYQVEINLCEDVSSTPVTEEGLQEIRKQLLSYNSWCLLGINFAAENLKSLILAFAIINHRVDISTAVYLSRIETIFQMNHWGNIEWSHDVDKAQTTSRVAAAALFVYLNEGSTNYVEKSSAKKESSQAIKAKL